MLLHLLQVLLDNSFMVVHRPRTFHTNADFLSRRPGASEVSDSDEERAIARIKKERAKNESLLDRQFYDDVATSQDGLDHHINTEHMSKKPLTFSEWKTLQKAKTNTLHALFQSNPEVLQYAQKPVSLSPWRYPSMPTQVN